jgi:hypothetical protein
MNIPITSQGTGLESSELNLFVTFDSQITIDGNGKFYDDQACTKGEATSKIVTSTSHQFWVKVTSGSCNIVGFFRGNLTGFGNTSTVGWNAITGNCPRCEIELGKILKTITGLYLGGGITSTGTLADLSRNLIFAFINGISPYSGNVNTLPAGIIQCHFTGLNTVTGPVIGIPRSCISFYIIGLNTLSGDFADLPPNITDVFITGRNAINKYTAGRVWAAEMYSVSFDPYTGGLTTAEIDSLLHDLAQTTWHSGISSIGLMGCNAPRSSASDADVAILISKGVIVVTN